MISSATLTRSRSEDLVSVCSRDPGQDCSDNRCYERSRDGLYRMIQVAEPPPALISPSKFPDDAAFPTCSHLIPHLRSANLSICITLFLTLRPFAALPPFAGLKLVALPARR